MVLHPLEFTDCFYDSPYFRENLHSHETELNRTSKAIKGLTKNCEEIFECARALSKAQRTFAENLVKFKFECIGTTETEDEQVITESCEKMGILLSSIEDTRDRLMDKAQEQFVQPLRDFRKKEIEEAMEMKRKFDRQSMKYSACVDRFVGVTTKKADDVLEEAESTMVAEQKSYLTTSMEYVLSLQRIQEKKKFQFVETLLTLIQGWKTFHHEAYDLTEDFQPFMVDLGHRLQLTREHFVANFDSAEKLMRKLLIEHNSFVATGSSPSASVETTIFKRRNPVASRQGYLFLMDKKPWGTTWNKVYCTYKKQNKVMTLIPYQPGHSRGLTVTETHVVTSCVRRTTDSIEKRWCFDVTAQEKGQNPITFQAMGRKDREEWLAALEGKEPDYAALGFIGAVPKSRMEDADAFIQLNEIGRVFVSRSIQLIESKGVENHEGLYRLVGSASRVKKLIHQYFLGGQGLPPNSLESLQRESADVKILTSALKQYLRTLPEPLLTFELYPAFVTAVRQENKRQQIDTLSDLVQHRLPPMNREILSSLVQHLIRVAAESHTNLMTKTNLGVCFGPTLLRSEEESMASIMDVKFCNIVVEHFIDFADEIFGMSSSGQSSPFPGTARPRPAGRSPLPARKDRKPAPTPPKRPPKFATSSTPVSSAVSSTPQQLTPLKTGPNLQQALTSEAAGTAPLKNPFDEEEDEPLSPVTDPSNPFYDEIPSNLPEKEKSPPPALPPTPPAKTRLYPGLSEYEEIGKPANNTSVIVNEPTYCVDRRFLTEAPTASSDAPTASSDAPAASSDALPNAGSLAASTRSSASSIEVEILPSVTLSDNDRNNNNSSSNNNVGGDNVTNCNAVSNDTYCSVIPSVAEATDAGDIEIFIDAPSSPSSPHIDKKITTTTTTSIDRVNGAYENVEIGAPKSRNGSYDDVPPSYAVVQKIKKSEFSSSSYSSFPALEPEDASFSSMESDSEVHRRDRPVASPRRRPLSQTRPPLPPIPTHAVSDLAINKRDDDDDDLIQGSSNLSLDEALYETVLPRSSVSGYSAASSTAAISVTSCLSPQAPSRSRRSIHRLNAAQGDGADAGAEPVDATTFGRDASSKEAWVPINQR